MPRKNIFIKSKKNIDKVNDVLKQRSRLFDKELAKRQEDIFKLVKTQKGRLDTRDLKNLSYAFSFSNPLLSDEEYIKKLNEMFDAFTPVLNDQDIETLREYTREALALDKAKKIRELETIDEKLKAHEKKYGKDKKYYELESVSTLDKINQKYSEAEIALNSQNITIYELSYIINNYGLKGVNLDRFLTTCARNVCVSAKKYLDFLDNFQEYMACNYKKLNPYDFKDTYKCTIFAVLCQTFDNMKKEFRDYYNSKINSLEDVKRLENIHVLADPIGYEITKDLRRYNFNASAYSELTLGTEVQMDIERQFPENIWKNTQKYIIQTSLIKGKINLNLHEESYKLYKLSQRFLDNINKPKNEQINPLNHQEAQYFENMLDDSLSDELCHCTLLETSDARMTKFLKAQDFEKFYIDGVSIKEIEPLKSCYQVADGQFNLRNALLISNTIMLQKIMEGNHYINYVRYTEFNDTFSYEIIPLDVRHNKDGYVKAETNILSKIRAYFTNVDKKYDNLKVKDQNQIDKYNNLVRQSMRDVEEKYYQTKGIENPNREKLENNLINDLNLSKDNLNVVNNKSNIELDNVIDTSSKNKKL